MSRHGHPNLVARTVERDRDNVRSYLRAMDAGAPVAARHSYVVASGNKHLGDGWEYPCGCWVPVGYPLYRHVEPCGTHSRALGG